MTDRELLELAAKAAGIELLWTRGGLPVNTPTLFEGMGSDTPWNPLTDDGDALRLAVKLRLVVSPWGGTIYVTKPGVNPVDARVDWGPNGDIYAATRRAIVRAAAQIGRAMK